MFVSFTLRRIMLPSIVDELPSDVPACGIIISNTPLPSKSAMVEFVKSICSATPQGSNLFRCLHVMSYPYLLILVYRYLHHYRDRQIFHQIECHQTSEVAPQLPENNCHIVQCPKSSLTKTDSLPVPKKSSE